MSESARTPSPAPRPSGPITVVLRLIMRFIVVLLSLFIGTSLGMSWYFSSDGFREQITKHLSKALRLPVTIDSISGSISYPTGEFLLVGNGLRVESNEPSIQRAPLIAIDRFVIIPAMLESLSAGLTLSSFHADAPQVTLTHVQGRQVYWPQHGSDSDLTYLPINQVNITGATVRLLNTDEQEILRLDRASLTGSFNLRNGVSKGTGRLSIEQMLVRGVTFTNLMEADLTARPDEPRLDKIRAKLFGGEATGSLLVRADASTLPFRVGLNLRDVESAKLAEFLGLEEDRLGGPLTMTFAGGGDFLDANALRIPRGDINISPFRLSSKPGLDRLMGENGLGAFGTKTFNSLRASYMVSSGQLTFKEFQTWPPNGAYHIDGKGVVPFNGQVNFQATLRIDCGQLQGVSVQLDTLGLGGESLQTNIPFSVSGPVSALTVTGRANPENISP